MAFVYRRKNVRFWWMCWTDADGVEQRASSRTEDEAEVKALANELESQARTKARREVLGALTVQRFYDETWLPLRKRHPALGMEGGRRGDDPPLPPRVRDARARRPRDRRG
jgi:hypothetical protein